LINSDSSINKSSLHSSVSEFLNVEKGQCSILLCCIGLKWCDKVPHTHVPQVLQLIGPICEVSANNITIEIFRRNDVPYKRTVLIHESNSTVKEFHNTRTVKEEIFVFWACSSSKLRCIGWQRWVYNSLSIVSERNSDSVVSLDIDVAFNFLNVSNLFNTTCEIHH
jgi:hypothetical protein